MAKYTLNFILPQAETRQLLRFEIYIKRAYCRCGVYKILERRGARLTNGDCTAGLSIYLCGQRSLLAKYETLILAAKQIRALA